MPSRPLCGVVAAHRNHPPAYASYGGTGHYWFPEDAWLRRGRAYYLLTRGRIADSETNGMLGAEELRSIERSVADSPLFARAGGNSAGAVHALRPTTGSTP